MADISVVGASTRKDEGANLRLATPTMLQRYPDCGSRLEVSS